MWREVPVPNATEIKIEYLNEGTVAVVSLNRAAKFNAITYEMFDNLRIAFEYLGRNESEVRAIVFTGVGKNFTAGLDLKSAMMMQ